MTTSEITADNVQLYRLHSEKIRIRIRLPETKSAVDALPTPTSDVVYWDANCPGFGVKVKMGRHDGQSGH